VSAANVNSIAQIIELATGIPPSAAQLDGWTAYENSGGSFQSIVEAFVASSMFADKYNNGVPVDPESPITSPVANEIIQAAIGGTPTSTQLDSWVETGLSTAEVFQDFALGDQFAVTLSSQFFIAQNTDGSYQIIPHDPGSMQIVGISDLAPLL
jgi:hypothetical protein